MSLNKVEENRVGFDGLMDFIEKKIVNPASQKINDFATELFKEYPALEDAASISKVIFSGVLLTAGLLCVATNPILFANKPFRNFLGSSVKAGLAEIKAGSKKVEKKMGELIDQGIKAQRKSLSDQSLGAAVNTIATAIFFYNPIVEMVHGLSGGIHYASSKILEVAFDSKDETSEPAGNVTAS